jgi:tetratricopeptide (TPR) repeat protein
VSVSPGLLSDPREDQALYTAALALQPLSPELWYRRARASARLKQWDHVLADLERCLALDPGHAAGHDLIGQALRLEDRRKEALAHSDQAVAAQPESTDFRKNRYWLRLELGRYDLVLQDLEKLVELCPNEVWIRNALAWILATGPQHLRNLPRARQLAEQVVDLRPDVATYFNTLGVVYYRLGEYARALDKLSVSLEKHRGRFEAFDLYFVAMAQQRLGQTEQARATLDKAERWFARHASGLTKFNQAELTAFREEALTVVSDTTASSVAAGSSVAGPIDGDRFGTEGATCWRGRAGEASWWWQIRFAQPRQVGAILQVVGDHPTVFRNAPRRYVWQASADGKTWEDLAETATKAERRIYRIHRLKAARTVQFLRLQMSAAEGDFPTLREVEFFSDPKRVIDFPDWAVLLDTTGKRRLPGEARVFLPLAQRCKGWGHLAAQETWLGDFDEAFVSAEPRPLCAFLSGNFIDWCQQDRRHWRGVAEVLKAGHLPLWASCGGAQGLAILAETGTEKPWDCPHCRDSKAPKLPIYTHIGHTDKWPCGDYSACRHERGAFNILQTAADPVFEGLPREFRIMESHCGQIEWAPAGWELIATRGAGTLTKTQCLRRRDRPIYAAQFHIELNGTPESSRQIMGNFLKIARAWGGYNPAARPLAAPRPHR